MRWLFFIAFFYSIKTGLRISLMHWMILKGISLVDIHNPNIIYNYIKKPHLMEMRLYAIVKYQMYFMDMD